ncbi:GTP 3',8-cyclase MoaA [Paludibacterium purpuratum]|uniref:GTP 3',8-cyclase n=1 Tax=Paludibacterium purpuratum TaxID=1144873 RepID=A0A4R7B7X2_9NEIS|nr:GTP 3',8-cyclase MoaA [Paludibacterium purpuratum]TDR79687.1 cyclic pyranopterin monophosphate synthase subunit MoaA [Paludibacterium purpuratum]
MFESSSSAPAELLDAFGRRIDYLRLSVTDRCDLRCRYCLPKGFDDYAEPADWLGFDEIERVVAAFAALGVRRFRLTGGEPLMRRNLTALVARLSVIDGVRDLSLSTNATQLARHAEALKQAGLSRLNVSLDSLDKGCMQQVTGRDSLDTVMAGLMAGKAAGLAPIKLNMVLMRGINDGEVGRMAAFCFEHGFILRLIEAMPMGASGRNTSYLPVADVLPALIERFGLVPSARTLGGGPARYWQTPDGRGQLGTITPISQHFCATCNRVRLSVDGTLYLCLGQEDKVELRPLMRAGCDDATLRAAIVDAIRRKPEKHHFVETPAKILRFMSQTGG